MPSWNAQRAEIQLSLLTELMVFDCVVTALIALTPTIETPIVLRSYVTFEDLMQLKIEVGFNFAKQFFLEELFYRVSVTKPTPHQLAHAVGGTKY